MSEDNEKTEILPSNADAQLPSQQHAPKPGYLLKDRFLLEEVLGEGGMGVVYRARDQRQAEVQEEEPFIAVKVLGDAVRDNRDAIVALQRETRKSQQLAHPNVVNVFDFDRDGEHVFMTMEYLQGLPLNEWMSEQGPVGLKLGWFIVEAMGKALAYAHSQRIVHCDFKPANVFVSKDNVVKVIDFGIARAAATHDESSSRDSEVKALGAFTPAYASLEILQGEEPMPTDDAYAFACVVYLLLTGRHPYGFKMASQAKEEAIKPEQPPGLPSRQWQALKKGLALTREQRYESIEQMLRELTPYGESSSLRKSLMISAALTSLGVAAIWLLGNGTGNDNYVAPKSLQQQLKEDQLPDARELAPDEEEALVELLDVAEVHMQMGFLIEPPGMNALDAFRRAQVIAPNERRVLQGLAKLADHFAKLAREAIAEGEPQKAAQMIDAGLDVDPGHPELNAMHKQFAYQ